MTYAAASSEADQPEPDRSGTAHLPVEWDAGFAGLPDPSTFDVADGSGALQDAPLYFWLAKLQQPRTLVELGAHRAIPYFAACAAVANSDRQSLCYSIAEPDDDRTLHVRTQAGQDHNAALYAMRSQLLYCPFAEAAESFAPGSIDLLMLDTTVLTDDPASLMQDWRARLSEHAVLVLNGLDHTPARQLFDKLRAERPGLAINGVGVLAMGTDCRLAEPLAALACDASRAQGFSTLFAWLGKAAQAARTTAEPPALGTAADTDTEAEARPEATATERRQWSEIARLTQSLIALKQEDESEALRARLKDAETRLADLQSAVNALQHNIPEALAAVAAPERPPGAVSRRLSTSLRRLEKRIREAGLIDAEWYLRHNPDLSDQGLDPVRHYTLHGISERRLPRDMTKPFSRKTR
ncbi:hypothetical protein ACOXXX_18080 [Thalassococcus sp. BH17M4-6]|uniref:hypothetical protein n=1 Tax=Thalassococcus sp. BH17M4-6 TaxID=3413148 RepID=UPI003BC7AD58